jgi:hypothetical protein
MTGLAMAGVVATVGLLVIPNRRRQAKRELRAKVTQLREQLALALRRAFEAEVQRSVGRIGQHLEPYSRFVRAEHAHLEQGRDSLAAIRRRLDALRDRVQRLEQTRPERAAPDVSRAPAARARSQGQAS